MSEKPCCGPISILFVSIVTLLVAYVLLRSDMLCTIALFFTAILGLVIIYDILKAPSSPAEKPHLKEVPVENENRGEAVEDNDLDENMEEDEESEEGEYDEADEDTVIAAAVAAELMDEGDLGGL